MQMLLNLPMAEKQLSIPGKLFIRLHLYTFMGDHAGRLCYWEGAIAAETKWEDMSSVYTRLIDSTKILLLALIGWWCITVIDWEKAGEQNSFFTDYLSHTDTTL